ncbi:hypothetical protein PhCBS80983_g01431 [Powellomyces hirtus]|uniref:Nodulin-like domain-containing protein n=1 Tax=Powellomyces hirtus TaxID=109895 RepID=A0A507EAK1_9FUNG|nr:hypothetical protein PhCBS80983_g01431 [Powellomyces hirtus]
MFAVASTGANVASLPIGACLDRYGPRATVLVGSMSCLLGNLLFGLSGPKFDGYLAGFLMLGIGGPFCFIGCLHISTVFPSKSGLIMAAMTGAFDASSSIYVFFEIIHEKLGGSIHRLFLFYTLVPVIVALTTMALMPKHSFGKSDVVADGDEEEEIVAAGVEEPTETQPLLASSPAAPVVSTQDLFSKQLKSVEFWGITGTVCIMMLRLNFYISSVKEQAIDLAGTNNSSTAIDNLLRFFNIALPAAGIISIPAIGYLLDNFAFSTSLAVLWGFGVAFGVLGLIHSIPLQYVTISIFVVMRPLLYTIGNDFCAKTFGFHTFGRLYGIMNGIAGVLNLLQYPLNYISLDLMGGKFWLSNGILLALAGGGLAGFPAYLARGRV